MVIDVVTWSSGMPPKSTSMSRSVSTATPHMPTSPSERGESESYPINVGKSKAVERPVCPSASRYLKRWFVCSGVPKPANMRMVQSRPRYIVGCTPRVKGYCPGRPSASS